jgi:hypothetical protein
MFILPEIDYVCAFLVDPAVQDSWTQAATKSSSIFDHNKNQELNATTSLWNSEMKLSHWESLFHSRLPTLSRLGNSGMKPPFETGLILPWTLGPCKGQPIYWTVYTLLWSYHTSLPSIPHSIPLLCFILPVTDRRQPLLCSLLHHLQPRQCTNLQCTIATSLLHLDVR